MRTAGVGTYRVSSKLYYYCRKRQEACNEEKRRRPVAKDRRVELQSQRNYLSCEAHCAYVTNERNQTKSNNLLPHDTLVMS
jgi:hypothetical protein